MLFSVLHPTARVKAYPSFPDGWRDAMFDCFSKCVEPSQVEYVISVHASRWEDFWLGDLGAVTFPQWGKVTVVKNDGRDDNCTQVNCAAAASSGEILIGTMDDLLFPRNWDVVLLDAFILREAHGTMQDQLNRELIIHCSTGSPRDWEPLINAGALTRKRYERFGYIGFPGYESMYLDNEFTAVAYRDGVVVQRPDIEFIHNHPAFNKSLEPDEIYCAQNREEAYLKGRELYMSRMAAGFPSDGKPGPVAMQMPRRKTVALCFPGESFSASWNAQVFALFVNIAQNYAVQPPLPLWAQSSNVYDVRLTLHQFLLGEESKPDFVLWLDSDQLIDYEQFDLLMKDLEQREDLDVVAGWSWCRADGRKHDALVSCGYIDANGRPTPYTREEMLKFSGDVIPVKYTGFPAVLMRYAALEKVGPLAFAPRLGKQFGHGFCGEDVAFSLAALENGSGMAVDRRVRLPHLKLIPDDESGLAPVVERKVG